MWNLKLLLPRDLTRLQQNHTLQKETVLLMWETHLMQKKKQKLNIVREFRRAIILPLLLQCAENKRRIGNISGLKINKVTIRNRNKMHYFYMKNIVWYRKNLGRKFNRLDNRASHKSGFSGKYEQPKTCLVGSFPLCFASGSHRERALEIRVSWNNGDMENLLQLPLNPYDYIIR